MNQLRRIPAAALLFAGLLPAALAQTETAALPSDLTELSLDELLGVEVTTVSKRPERASSAAAAIFVITGEDIRRSGARSLAEALRLVPGMQVARNGASYAISARGFTSTSADKLEVLLDGRSVYTPLSSAVFWDVLDTYLADVDRIEVIRGPGATLWGANAVNGVINIVTRTAGQTLGTVVEGGVGTEERVSAAARTGSAIGNAGHVRLYGKAFERDPGRRSDGSEAANSQRHAQAGFRSDWAPLAGHELTVQGDLYDGRIGSASGPTDVSGANLLTRWSGDADPKRAWSLQLFYDTYERSIPTVFAEDRETFDVDFQQRLQLGARNDVVYGAGVMVTHDQTAGPPSVIIFDPQDRTLTTYSAFIQDQLHWGDKRWSLTAGAKVEHNDFTGFEWQPSLRLGWQAQETLFTWAAVSRAVRTPNRIDHDIAIFCAPAFAGALGCTPGSSFPIGSRSFESEELLAFEWGLRWWLVRGLSVDLATYYNDYDKLRSSEPGMPIAALPRFANGLEAKGYGAELSVAWQPFASLQLRPFYSWQELDVEAQPGSADTNTPKNLEGSQPRHMAGLRTAWNFAPRWTLDGFLRYVGELERTATPSASSGDTKVPAYFEQNLRVAWQPWERFEFALVGQNLLDRSHPELGGSTARIETERSVLFTTTWEWQ